MACVEFLLGRLQLPLQRHEHFDQPIERDPSREDIFLELLNVHASFIIHSPKSCSASFRDIDGYVSQRVPWLAHEKLDVIVKSGR